MKLLLPDTLERAEYVVVHMTVPKKEFSNARILELYRMRWRIELVFKP
jgi:IS4 transposase